MKVSIILCFLVVFLLCQNAKGRPSDRQLSRTLPERYECGISERYQDTCQRCAKITKSPIVYPMCCDNKEGVYDWCEEYVYFGERGGEPTTHPRTK